MYRPGQSFRLNELTDEQIEALMDSCPTDSEPDDDCEEYNDNNETIAADNTPISWSFLEDVLNEEIIIDDNNVKNIQYNNIDCPQNISEPNIDLEIVEEVCKNLIIFI